ncbi:glycosyltransferase [Adlercreutzia murintestinalis]|uniref:glycosyltransferase n=1 Tax=Adlercreutzia murintestinalis TaxID=2941325 RepID=UPI002042281A|nr:glycosyltransferase [Adlercreutzia murintestinalis]
MEESRDSAWVEILSPVRNEEGRLEEGIEKTVGFLEPAHAGEYRLTIVDNDSHDGTQRIAEQLCEKHPQVSYLRIDRRGVGAAVRAGVAQSRCPVVGYMDIDLATDLRHVDEVLDLFRERPDLEMVNGSRWARGYGATGRGLKRTITSMGLTAVLKVALGMEASDAICGFKFFRREIAEALIDAADRDEDGWFFIIEMLLLAERGGVRIHELPVVWRDDGHSSVEVGSVIRSYLTQIAKLRKRFGLRAASGE